MYLEDIPSPVLSMNGVQLGFGLAELARLLVERTNTLMSVSLDEKGLTEKDSERFLIAGNQGDSALPMIRGLLLRYAQLVVAKQRPDLEGFMTERGVFNLDTGKSRLTATDLAKKTAANCSELLFCEIEKVEPLLTEIELLLALHAQACGNIWPELYAKARDLEELPD